VFIVSFLIAIVNIGSGKPNFMLHAIMAFTGWLGGLGFSIFGIIWLVQFIIAEVKAT
jgi:hypothetical protein